MTRPRHCAGAVLLGLLAACGPTSDPSATPVVAPRILACIGIPQAPCANVAARVVAELPAERGVPHCGLLHVLDFDGSFWVPVGQLGDDSAMVNAIDGRMTLMGPDRAKFSSGGKLIATLARYPGPRRFWLCA